MEIVKDTNTNTGVTGAENTNTATLTPGEGQQTQTGQTQEGQQNQQNQQQEDIVTRVNKMANLVKPVDKETVFDVKELESITDPTLKDLAVKMYKTFQRGWNSKYQELASLRKELEAKTGISQDQWTPDRIQGLLKDPAFVHAAQSVITAQGQQGGLSNEEYSALTDSEKRQLSEMQNQLQMITQQNSSLIQQQQDEKLKTRYASYDTKIVNDMTHALLSGKYQATREDIWKVIDYENAVKRAYELGKQDRQENLQEKVESNSTEGLQVTNTEQVPNKNQGESNLSYFKRLAQRRLAESRSGKLR